MSILIVPINQSSVMTNCLCPIQPSHLNADFNNKYYWATVLARTHFIRSTITIPIDFWCDLYIYYCDNFSVPSQLAPHRTRSVNPECTTPQDAFLTNMMDFEEFVPPIPPPPYYPPEYTCSSETDAQRSAPHPTHSGCFQTWFAFVCLFVWMGSFIALRFIVFHGHTKA